jgi:minor extracellular serine protease Vpr
VVLLVLPVLLLGPLPFAAGGGRSTDTQPAFGVIDNAQAIQDAIRSGRTVTVVVQLADEPLATYTGGIGNIGATAPVQGSKLDVTSNNAIGYGRLLEEKRSGFKAYLRNVASGALVGREYNTVLNGLSVTVSGRDLARILTAPGVTAVTVARTFKPTMNISRVLIGASAIDAALSPSLPGAGIKVGIIDTGIDRDHPFFNPAGYAAPPGFPKADTLNNLLLCTSDKIIVARAYPDPNGNGPNSGEKSCLDTIDHGTHVAGTVAGNAETTATVSGVAIPGLSGVAPRAWLGNYNVFPNGQVNADDPEIIAAIEDAVRDGMDVLNMSLGGDPLPEALDPLAQAVNRAARAGVVVAVAAGNSGSTLFTVSSPGTAHGALTAAASADPHFVGIPATFDTTTLGAALGQFGTFNPAVSAALANWNNMAAGAGPGAATMACTAITTGTHTGQIVVIDRGSCTFTTKVRNAQNAGAAGVMVVNSVAGDPVAMAQDGTTPIPTIPAVMVGRSTRGSLRSEAALNRVATIDGATPHEFVTSSNLTPDGATANADVLAGFSSRGPTAFDFRLKPDVSAPGVNVLSSVPGGWAFFQGTSMATPHLAGSAALLLQLHPGWSPEQVKSALVTRAKRPVFDSGTGTVDTSAVDRGGGRVNLARAMNVNATFGPANISFGALTPASEEGVRRSVELRNISGFSQGWTAAIGSGTFCRQYVFIPPPAGVFVFTGLPVPLSTIANVSVNPTAGNVGAARTNTFGVTATALAGTTTVLCTGDIVVAVGSQTHRLPWLLVRNTTP